MSDKSSELVSSCFDSLWLYSVEQDDLDFVTQFQRLSGHPVINNIIITGSTV